jgi:Baseplate J-like protein
MAITQQQLQQVYASAILAEDPNLQPSLNQGQDLYFKSKSTSLVVATAIQEVQNLQNNIIPSSSSSTFLYKHAASLGIPPIVGALPSFGNMGLVASGNSPVAFTIAAGTILTNPSSAVQYFVLSDVNVTMSQAFNTVVIPFQSVLSGSVTYSPPGTTLQFMNPLVLTSMVTISQAIITSIVSGTNTPTDLDVSGVVSGYMQNPRGGGSTGDYYKWALASNPTIVTNAIIIPAGALTNTNIIYVAIMGGSSDPSINVNIPYPIDRSIDQPVNIAITQNYIEGLRPVNDNPVTASVLTYNITNSAGGNPLNCAISINVVLSPGLTLATQVVGTNGVTQSVEQWIQYQTRYAVLSAPYGGTMVNGSPVILGAMITTLLLNGLADTNNLSGYLCSILVDVEFSYSDNTPRTNVPDIPVLNSSQYFIPPAGGLPPFLQIVYDLDVDIITVSVI